jgi:molybdate transport repressor ModE-like protein
LRLIPALCWTIDGIRTAPIDPRLIDLLGFIETHGSLRAACDEASMAYRTAWGLLQDTERLLGGPLVKLRRGRGAELTRDGLAIVRADQAARQRWAKDMQSLSVDVGATGGRSSSGGTPVLRVAASHDPALAGLQDALPAAAGVHLDVVFCGSLEALERFRGGRADVAGFHFVPADTSTARPFLAQLRPSLDRLIRLVDREQGLIVPRGNPRRLTSLADVAARQLRFVNRQPGSGTRMLIDAQLLREHVPSERLDGYCNEEYTHGAVAATVASGQADAGFGVAAAAAEYGLGFVPVVRERYYLAVRAIAVRSQPVVALREALAGPIFRKLVDRMHGYDAARAGEVERVAARSRRRQVA